MLARFFNNQKIALSKKILPQKGIALIEVMIALGLFSLTATSIWILAFQSDESLRRSAFRFSASGSINDLLENHFFMSLRADWADPGEISIERPASFGDFNFETKYRYSTHCLAEVQESVGSLEENVLVFDIGEYQRRGHDCGGYPDFKKINDVEILPSNFNSNFGNVQATGIDLFSNSAGHIFLTSFKSVDESGGELEIDLAAISEQGLESTLDIGPGLNAIDFAANVLYGAQKSSKEQLVIVDYSDLSDPFLIATSTLPGVAGVRPEGWSIFYYDHRVYIGTKRTAGHEFHIFDVQDPSNPIWLGSREMNHNINQIAVRGGRAFLATSGNARDLIILDVSNPASISLITELDLPGNEDGRSLALLGNQIYLGRFKSAVGNPDLYIIDKKDFSILGSYTVSAEINSIAVQHDYAILGTSKTRGVTGTTLQVLNIASTTQIYSVASINTPEKITGVDYQDNKLLISTFGGENIIQIDLVEN